MNDPSERDLVMAVLFHVLKGSRADQEERARAVGLCSSDVALLRSLTLDEIREIGIAFRHGVQVAVDRQVLRAVIDHVRATREGERLQRRLLEADAPREMMRRMFGMGSREYAELRRELDLPMRVGRPPAVDEATSHRLWYAVEASLGSDPDRPIEPEQFLELPSQTGVSLRSIWPLVSSWAAEHGARTAGR